MRCTLGLHEIIAFILDTKRSAFSWIRGVAVSACSSNLEMPLDEYLAVAGCDSEKLTRQISGTKLLAGIARKLNKWKEVRPWLDLDEADEDAITRDYQTTERRRSALKTCFFRS